MDNPDAVLHALKEFAENRQQSIPQVLEEYLCYVAITGKPLFPWSLLKPLFVAKMEKVLRDIHGDYLDQFKPHYFKIKSPTFDAFKKRIMKGVNEIDGIPFTVQRLCELLAYPRENYNSGEKYLKALFKVILVVTTIDPSGKVVAPSRPKFKKGKVVGQLQGESSLYSSSDTSNPAAGSSHPNQTPTADVSYDDPSPSTSHSHQEEPESMDSSAEETSTAAEASMDETDSSVQSMASAWKLPPRLKCGKRWKKAPSARGWQRLEDIQAGSCPIRVVGALRSIVEMEVEDDEGEDNTPRHNYYAGDTDKDTDTADLPAATMDSRDAKRQRSPGAAPRPAEDISSSQHSCTAASPPPKKKWLAAYDDKYGSGSSSDSTASGEVNRSEESAQMKLNDSDSSSKSKDDSNQSESSTDSSTNSSKSKDDSNQSESSTDSSTNSSKRKDNSDQSENRTDSSSKSKDDSDQSENRTDSSSSKSKDNFDQSESSTDSSSKSKDNSDQSENSTDSSSKSEDDSDQSESSTYSSSKSKDDFDQSESRTDSSSCKSKDDSVQSESGTDSSSKSKDDSDQSESRTDSSSKSKDESDQSESRTDDDSVNDEEKTVSTADTSSDSDSTTSAEETSSLDLSPPPLSDGSPAAPVTETSPAFSSQAESPHSDQAK